jgi:hypothetical protein
VSNWVTFESATGMFGHMGLGKVDGALSVAEGK